MKIVNPAKNTVLAENAEITGNPLKRMKGLIGRKFLEKGSGLLIKHCNSIHMFFMSFPIDVVFASAQNQVVGLKESIRPWRMSAVYFSASFVIELPAGTIRETHTAVGDFLTLIP